MLQVLIDADNVPAARVRDVLVGVEELGVEVERRIIVAGHPDVLEPLEWPPDAEVLQAEGWQRADLELAAAYIPESGPLVLVSGDRDFLTLALRHPGPVLVVSEAAAGAYREVATVIDPVQDGIAALRAWLRAVADDA